MSQVIELCSIEECTGCEACQNSCASGCIEMKPDEKGFLLPVINHETCTKCGLCVKKCPVLNKPQLQRTKTPKVYACWHKDDGVRMKSSSGGLFSVLAESVLKDNGIVYGAAYDQDMVVRHKGIDAANKLDDLRRSKYVQSEIGNTFKQAKENLRQGKKVLFVGTPCQVSGLHSYLGKEYPNLITCDFICHGVPSPKVFKSYINWLEKKENKKITSINFRNKKNGWENILSTATTSRNNEINLSGQKNNFYYGFVDAVFNRECCYNCKYMTYPRVADFTLGDFWGIGDKIEFSHSREKKKGISLLMVNSEKLSILKTNIVELEERTRLEAEMRNVHLFKPVSLHPMRDGFFHDFKKYPFEIIVDKYLKLPIARKAKIFVKEKFNFSVITRLRKIARQFK
ncbi:MAG: Coenzyme F420 hydrogenase/dehydrogenase, beta subunit C-terminal domain [Bacteroidota bacterium]|nr:Coenzyme F420 hydrogenase/dehydrogenase, beta subunit C-terminal domain [Bacteroidota bacterium]